MGKNIGEQTPEDALRQLQARLAELEQANQQSAPYEAQLHFQANLLAQVSDAMVAVDNANRIIYWNTGATRLYGLTSEEVLGKPLDYAYIIQWPNQNARAVSVEMVAQTGNWRGDVSQLKRNGGEIYVDAAVSILRDTQGQRSGLLAVMRDITARKINEEAVQFLAEASILLSTSLNYELTLQSLTRLIVPTLADWCVFYLLEPKLGVRQVANAHVESAKEMVLNNLLERFPPGLNETVLKNGFVERTEPMVKSALTPANWMEVFCDPPAERLWQQLEPGSLMVVPVSLQNQLFGVLVCVSNQPTYYRPNHVVLAQELARRIALAVENTSLYRQTQQALEAQKALDSLKDQFLSIASHELRTPLAAVKGYVQMLQRQLSRRETAEEQNREIRMLANMDQQLIRMNNLIGEMLDISRIQNGKLELYYDDNEADLVEMAARLVEQQQEQAAITDHILALQTNHNSLFARLDEARIEQVLNNLISNALKYSPPGKPVTVGVELNERGGMATIWVRDEGIGINPAEQPYIFERYYRAGRKGNINVDGLGLGLFISQEIVTRHGGRIWLESILGEGSTFYFSLPLRPPHETQTPNESNEREDNYDTLDGNADF